MVEAITSLLPLMLSLLLLLSSANGVHNSYGEKTILQLHDFRWTQHSDVTSCSSQKSRRENGVTILEMKHRDSCSGNTIDWNKRLQKHIISDEIRVHSLQSRIKNSISGQIKDISVSEIPLTSGIKLQTLNYIVTVQLGDQNMTLIVDTGSDLTWVQCEPCKSCYTQTDPLFNPSKSASYLSVSCNTQTCEALQLATGNSGLCGGTNTNPPSCDYFVSYGDGSYTRGELGRANISLGGSLVSDFLFGCGRNNKGLFGGASGLMGLGRSDLSLISQTYALFGGVFSYCLPSTEAEASGSLILGSVYKNITPISYTRMVQNPQLSTFYLLNVTGISIGGATLQAPSFNNGGIGMLIDSGTVITRVVPSIYRALKSEFLKQFSGFPQAPGFSILDTCFNLSGYEEVNIPTIKFHFEGDSELNVDVSGIFYFVKTDATQVCLALASLSYEDEVGIIGNFQQRNIRVIYDTKESKLGFAKETCNFM